MDNVNVMIRDTNDTIDTEKVSEVSKESRIIMNALGSGEKEQILRCLYLSESPLSYEQISIRIYGNDSKKEYVKTCFSRNKDLFQEIGKDGASKLFGLSPLGENFIEQKLKEYVEKQANILRLGQAKGLKEIQDRELKQEAQDTIEELKKDIEKRESSLILDFTKIAESNPSLAEKLLENPEKVFKTFQEIGFLGDTKYIWRIKNLPQSASKPLELLRSEQIDRFIDCKARVVSRSEVRPQVVNAKFECPNCGAILSILQDEKVFRKPSRCTCGWKSNFRLLSKELRDVSKIYLEDLRGSGKSINPSRIKAIVGDDLCSEKNIEVLTPGNEVRISGILKENSVTLKRGETSTILDVALDINFAETIEPEADLSQISDSELEQIKQLQEKIDKEGIEVLIPSIAPHIYKDKHRNEVTKTLIFQASTPENQPKDRNVRTQINTLLIGDPGTAKSELAEFILDCVPGSQKAVGGGSSAVGITASVVKEPDEFGGYRVEAGTLPRAKILCLIDELNNLSDEDKPRLQEGMESKSVTVNKANIHTKIPVTAGIIATANPIKGRFDNDVPIMEQFNIPLPILNRFDIIFPFRDKVDSEIDGNIAQKMIERRKEKIEAEYSIEFLRKFFLYLRAQKEPEIETSIANKLREVYINARKEQDKNPLINSRFMNTLLRFVLASARVRGKSIVDLEDIKRSLEILKESFFKIGDWRLYLSPDIESAPIKKENKPLCSYCSNASATTPQEEPIYCEECALKAGWSKKWEKKGDSISERGSPEKDDSNKSA